MLRYHCVREGLNTLMCLMMAGVKRDPAGQVLGPPCAPNYDLFFGKTLASVGKELM